MLMNGGAAINYGNALRGNRRTAQPRPDHLPEEPDYGKVNVDALLGDSEQAHLDRAWAQSLRGQEAKQTLNALQKWMFEHDSPNDRKRWRLAYNVMTKLASNCDEMPQQLSVGWVRFTEQDQIGRGAFADIYKGVDYGGLPVAVKRLHFGDSGDRESGDLRRRFHREALIWFQLRHPNILPLIGIFKQSANFTFYPCMISPWADGGSIFQFIKSKGYNPRQQRIELLSDVARALEYVHERNVAHGDLHDGNVLVNQGRALLTDFGLTVVGDKSQSKIPTSDLPANTIRWIAPELLTEDDYTPRKTWEGDIFSFGRLCLAICTKKVPYAGLSDTEATLKLSMEIHPSMPQPQECGGVPMSNQLWKLTQDCWTSLKIGARPRAAEVLRSLQSAR